MTADTKLATMLEALDAEANRLFHLTKTAQRIFDEVPCVNAEGKRIGAMDELWSVLSATETLAQLLSDGIGDAVMQSKATVA